MPVSYPDKRVLPVAQLLLSCLSTAAVDNPKPPAIVGFRTGTDGQPLAAQNNDECCDGAAFVRVVRTFATWSVPTPSARAVRCGQPMGVEFELSMWRCATIGSINLTPAQAMWDELNTDLLNDRATMIAAVCCLIAQRNPETVAYGDWQAVSAEGGCVGATMSILVDLYGRGF